jgi:hypothetical protein
MESEDTRYKLLMHYLGPQKTAIDDLWTVFNSPQILTEQGKDANKTCFFVVDWITSTPFSSSGLPCADQTTDQLLDVSD